MIKFTSILPFSAGMIQEGLKRSKISSSYHEDEEGTGELVILQEVPAMIGPEDIIIVPYSGDPVIITRSEFYCMEVI